VLAARARRLAAFCARRARLTLVTALALALAATLLTLRLDANAGIDVLVDRDHSTFRATEDLQRKFGGDPVLVLVKARERGCPGGRDCRLTDIVLTPDLLSVLSLEGCMAGRLPRGAKPPDPVCRRFSRERPFVVVNGPGTFVNESARQITARINPRQGAREAERAARAAREVAAARGLSKAEQDRLARRARELAYLNALQPALRYGLGSGTPAAADPTFVHQLVFEPKLGFDVPKTRFAHLFPGPTSALIALRPRAGLDQRDRRQAIELVQAAVTRPRFALESADYLVAEQPPTNDAVASSLRDQVLALLVVTLVLVGAALLALARARRGIVALMPALVATALTFGAMSLTGGSFTISSLALLPVLIAIGTALATAFYRRVEELRRGSDASSAVEAAAQAEAPLLASAGLVAVAALLALLFAPVPVLRSFGGFLALGTALSALTALTVGSALAKLAAPRRSVGRRRRIASIRVPSFAVPRIVSLAGAAWRRSLSAASGSPGRLLAVAALLALVGAAVGMRDERVSDLRTLGPSDSRAAENASALRRETGRDGDLHVLVSAQDVTAPGVVAWMERYQRRVLARQRYSEDRPCRSARLCPALSPVSLLGSGRAGRPAQTRRLLRALGPNFTRSVVSADRRSSNITFSIKAMSPDEQAEVVDDMREQLDPPAGVRARVAGGSALAAEAAGSLQSSELLTLVALVFIFLALLALHRRVLWAAASLLPLVLAAGWSALILALLADLTPLTAALGVVVTALSASLVVVPFSTAYRSARERQLAPRAAVQRAYELAGAAIGASAVVAAAGFVALIAAEARMLQQFGALALLDLVVVLLGVALVLPASFVWLEERGPIRLPRTRAEAATALRRGAAGARALGLRVRALAAAARRAAPRVRRSKQLER
jgi:predicted RND superfamily exporter protein